MHPRGLNPGGTGKEGRTIRPAGGLAFLVTRRPCLYLLSCPLSPRPPSRREGGDSKIILPGATAPGTPAFNRLRHVQPLPCRCPAGACPRRRQFGAKPIESPFHGQCRQPRRGGTGGDGTIRRTRRRRLRWSSPPGRVEQVPRGGTADVEKSKKTRK